MDITRKSVTINTEIKRSFKIHLQFVSKTVPLKLSSGETADETNLSWSSVRNLFFAS
ncbi:MAG: hypothetical protein RLZZ532_2071 [Cyanobacteriota bacterium]|jgi:hypothetical protein